MSFERSQLVHEISSVRFTPVRLREGYDFTEVDEILDRLAAAITAGELVDDVVRGARFTEVRLREGYAKAEVDAFLLRVVERARTLPADEPVDAEPPVVEYRPLPPRRSVEPQRDPGAARPAGAPLRLAQHRQVSQPTLRTRPDGQVSMPAGGRA